MSVFIATCNIALPVLYLGLCIIYVVILLRDDPIADRTVTPLTAVTLLTHLCLLVLQGMHTGQLPLSSFAEFLSVLCMALVCLYIVVERLQRVRETGFVVMGLAFGLQLVSSALLGQTEPDSPLLQRPGFAVHVVLIVLAYTSLALSFLYGVLYLVQARSLSRRSFGLTYRRLPSLATLERMTLRFVELGVPLLFVALLSGHLWMFSVRGTVEPSLAARLSITDPKILTAWATFIIYGFGLIGNQVLGWRGRRVIWFAIWAFALMILSTGVVRLTVPSFHQFNPELGL